MAYGSIYVINWYDLLNRQKRLQILQEDYTGAETELRADADPVVSYWEPDEDLKYPLFKASSLDVRLMSPSRMYFRTLFTSNKFKFLVKYFVTDMVNHKWKGYLLPDEYTEPYEHENYPVSFKAVDGLGYLANIDFLDDDGEYYTGRKTDLEIILICLNKLNLENPVMTAVNIFETRMDNGVHADPLAQAYTDCEVFKDMKCAEVLKEILKPYGAVIMHRDGWWRVIRLSYLRATSYKALAYGYTGLYLGYTIVSHNKNLTNENAAEADRNVLVMGRTTVRITPAIKQLKIIQDYGYQDNFLEGGEMSNSDFEWDDDDEVWRTDLWRNHSYPAGDGDYAPGEYVDNKNDQMALVLSAPPSLTVPTPLQQYWVHQDPPTLYADLDQEVVFEFQFRVRAIRPGAPQYAFPVKVYAFINIGNYNFNGTWQLPSESGGGENLYLYLGQYASNCEWQTVTFVTENIPASGPLTIWLQQARGYDPTYSDGEFEILYKKVGIKIICNADPFATEVELTTIVNEDNNYEPDDVEIMVADVPYRVNHHEIYKNGKTLADGSLTRLWQVPGTIYQEPLIVALARMITNQYFTPSIMYDGSVEDSHLEPDTLVKDNWENIQLMVQDLVRNEGTNEAQVKLIQLLADPPSGSFTHSLRLK